MNRRPLPLLVAGLLAVAPPNTEHIRLQAARAALEANHRLAVRVLWLDALPASAAASTRGPALEQLRTAAVARRRDGVRIRMMGDRYQISGLRLVDGGANAFVVDRERVQPCSLAGRPLGAALNLSEHAHVQLHRLAGGRYVVWQLR